jgi:fluoroquinolone resistance protein
MQLFQDLQYQNIDFTIEVFPKGEYEACQFQNCNMSNLDLTGYIFIDCTFENSNLSLVKLHNTILRDIQFKGCKMIGLQFCDANEFGLALQFENCILTNASFYKTKLKKTQFIHSKLNEVDFTEADLTASVFTNADLSNAIFSFTNLEQADLRGAKDYVIDPETNKLKKSKHNLTGLEGLLLKYNLIVD